jgi:hypothetical protein
MKITLCGSIAFYSQMQELKQSLEQQGHEVRLPPHQEPDENGNPISVSRYYEIRKTAPASETWVWKRKEQAMREHFEKVEWADAILVTNFDKKGVSGYIGGNTLMEMALAFHLQKKIFLWNPIPELPYTEEILGLQPIVVEKDLKKIC